MTTSQMYKKYLKKHNIEDTNQSWIDFLDSYYNEEED